MKTSYLYDGLIALCWLITGAHLANGLSIEDGLSLSFNIFMLTFAYSYRNHLRRYE